MVYVWCLDRVEDRDQFNMELEAPLPGQESKPTPAQEEAEGQAFMDMMSTVQSKEV